MITSLSIHIKHDTAFGILAFIIKTPAATLIKRRIYLARELHEVGSCHRLVSSKRQIIAPRTIRGTPLWVSIISHYLTFKIISFRFHAMKRCLFCLSILLYVIIQSPTGKIIGRIQIDIIIFLIKKQSASFSFGKISENASFSRYLIFYYTNMNQKTANALYWHIKKYLKISRKQCISGNLAKKKSCLFLKRNTIVSIYRYLYGTLSVLDLPAIYR